MKPIEHLVIIGTGLIAGSFALGLRQRGLVERVSGIDRDLGVAERAKGLGVVDAIADYGAVREAELVLIGVPTRASRAVFEEIAAIPPGTAVITDTGSVKVPVMRAADEALGGWRARFVPGHPIAGSERSGPEAADPELFVARRVVTTEDAQTDADASERVQEVWRALGALPEHRDAGAHDALLAETSHLPHAVAFALVDALATRSDRADVLRFAAGGFRDFTRIAASDPVMWRDIFMDNAAAVAPSLRQLAARIEALAAMVEAGDGAALEALIARARALRNELS